MSACGCGCGGLPLIARRNDPRTGDVKGERRKYILGHNSRKPAGAHKRYASIGERRAHVVIAERIFGKPLPTSAVVHHANGDRLDNRPENLVICQDQKYHMLLHRRMRERGGR